MEALFLKLVNLSITATYLALAVILLRLIFKKAPKWISCVLWGLVAVRLIFPFSIESVLSLIPSSEPIPQNFINTATPHIYSGFNIIDNAVNPILSSQLTPEVGASVNPTQVLSFVLSRIWLVGLCAMLIYAFLSWLLLKRRVRTATILEGNIRQSEFVDSPFVLGIFKPVIYLPYQIDSNDLAYVTAHEQAHIKRRDNWWKPFGFLLLSVYWFNPVMWIAYILLCSDIEAACDERVIRDMEKDELQAYSTALLNCSVHRRRIAACPLAFGEVGVKERIKTVMNYKKPAFWIIVVAVVACAVVAICFLTNPKPDVEPDTPNDTVLIAIVKEIHSGGQSMIVVGCDDNQEYSVPLVNLEPSPEPAVGDTVQIIYDGDILETSPLQFQKVLKIMVLNDISERQTVQWFDCLHGDEMVWDGRREINLDEFPNVTFRCYSEKLEAVTDKEIVPLYTGMPIWSVFFCDLTGDGKPELCSCVSIGSGVIDNRVIVYDYITGRSYELSDRMNFDYTLQLHDDQLWVEKREYAHDEVLESGVLAYQDGSIQVIPVVPAVSEALTDKLEIQDTTVSAEQLAIRGAIVAHNQSEDPTGLLCCASFVPLETVSATPLAGSSTHRVIYYGWVLYKEFIPSDVRLVNNGGSHIPTILTFDVSEDGEYSLVEYWTPRDGTYYMVDIMDKVPEHIREDMMDSQKFIRRQEQECYAQAINYSGIDPDISIEYLLGKITESPATSSIPMDYIEAHPIEYRELTWYGKYALRYCSARFEKGGETGLEGYIMMQLCDDIAKSMGESGLTVNLSGTAWLTAQQWYDSFKQDALKLKDKYAAIDLAEQYPASYLLLEMLGEV